MRAVVDNYVESADKSSVCGFVVNNASVRTACEILKNRAVFLQNQRDKLCNFEEMCPIAVVVRVCEF